MFVCKTLVIREGVGGDTGVVGGRDRSRNDVNTVYLCPGMLSVGGIKH